MYDARLMNFNRLMHRVPWRERKRIILQLNRCKETKLPWGESLAYKKRALSYEIYELIKGEPLTAPLFPSLATIQDVLNRQLSEKIMRGINGYLQAPLEKQRAFQRNLLNPYTPRNMLARMVGRFRKSY